MTYISMEISVVICSPGLRCLVLVHLVNVLIVVSPHEAVAACATWLHRAVVVHKPGVRPHPRPTTTRLLQMSECDNLQSRETWRHDKQEQRDTGEKYTYGACGVRWLSKGAILIQAGCPLWSVCWVTK